MSTPTMSTRTCPTCAAKLPPGSDDCPHCLLALGLALPSQASQPDAEQAARRAAPERRPTLAPEELARLFPGLVIEAEIGRGGMGVVYRARQRKLGRLVALKLLAPELAGDADFAERFLREARVLARLTHEHIVSVHDFGETEGLCWLLMEHVDGPDLRQVMQSGELTPEAALAIVPQICDALSAAHALGIVHRDIKPENVLLDASGHAKIADFGLAKLVDTSEPTPSLTRAAQAMGTPHYMAPEQMRGARDVDHRADIFSLGVVFYEMLTGQLPIGRFEAPSKRVELDVRLDEIVLRTLESRPERRYQSAVEVKSDVQRVSASPLVKPNPKAVLYAERESKQRRSQVRRLGFVITLYTLSAPAFLFSCWQSRWFGMAMFALFLPAIGWLGMNIGKLVGRGAWRRRREMEQDSLGRFAIATLIGSLGVAAGLVALHSIWMRSTPHYTPPLRGGAEWNADAARTRLRNLAGFADGDLPSLGAPAVLSSSHEWVLSDLSPKWPGVLCLLLLAASSLVVLSGRRIDQPRAALSAWLGPPALTLLALVHAGLWFELPFVGKSPRAYAEIAGSSDLPWSPEVAADGLAQRARERGYDVLFRRVVDWREGEGLTPVARQVEVYLRPHSPFERWRQGDVGPERRHPDLHVEWLAEPGASASHVTWSAGLLNLEAPEGPAWREEVSELLGRR